jgi:hypothetical protein
MKAADALVLSWQYHPGMLLATVADGSIKWYDARCTPHVRKAGDFFK